MAGLQRSSETFRRSGSSGLVWEDRFLSESSNEPKKSEQGGELKKSRSVGSGGGVTLDTTGYKTGRVSPTMDPPSPKVSACGFCGAFSKKGAAKKKGKKPRRR